MTSLDTPSLPADRAAVGARGRVAMVGGVEAESAGAESAVSARLRDLGFEEGAEIELVRRLPMGGPLTLAVAGTMVAMRPADARLIRMVPLA